VRHQRRVDVVRPGGFVETVVEVSGSERAVDLAFEEDPAPAACGAGAGTVAPGGRELARWVNGGTAAGAFVLEAKVLVANVTPALEPMTLEAYQEGAAGGTGRGVNWYAQPAAGAFVKPLAADGVQMMVYLRLSENADPFVNEWEEWRFGAMFYSRAQDVTPRVATRDRGHRIISFSSRAEAVGDPPNPEIVAAEMSGVATPSVDRCVYRVGHVGAARYERVGPAVTYDLRIEHDLVVEVALRRCQDSGRAAVDPRVRAAAEAGLRRCRGCGE
jgi:hypothetical protein